MSSLCNADLPRPDDWHVIERETLTKAGEVADRRGEVRGQVITLTTLAGALQRQDKVHEAADACSTVAGPPYVAVPV